jgi:hypothetical protein
MVATPNKPSSPGESSSETLWQRYEDWLYYHEGLGLYLDISRMGFEDSLVDSLKPRFEKAFQDMAELEGGAIANPDENRMVGHYWLRDPDLAPAELKSEIVNTLNDIEAFVQQVHAGTIKPAEARAFHRYCFPSALAARPWVRNLSPRRYHRISPPWALTSSTTPTRQASTGC